MPSRVTSLGAVLFAVIALPACRPEYPNCDSDKDCHEKEYCVGRKCQQCRDDKDCPPGQACAAGKCEAIPGYCASKAQCPPGQECIGNRCKPCAADGECPSGTKCVRGECTSKKPCTKDDECAQDEDCVNGFCEGGKKVAPPPSQCTLGPVYFDFNESALTTETTSALAANADCIKKVDRPVTLIGHADPRGTSEYNLALSERRAQSVKSHFERLGIAGNKLFTLPRGSLDAHGTGEATWAKDRRVDSEWR